MILPVISIKDQSNPKNTSIDYSFLFNQPPAKMKVTASDKDAQLLFELWSKGEKCKRVDTVKINPSLNIASRDLIRLKTLGFISGNKDEVQFTRKGKMIITTMSLAEQNAFEKIKSNKSYTEILASMNKRGKKGYRMASSDPKFKLNSGNNLNLKEIFK